MSNIANRAQLAKEFGISLPTVDDWVRRGCPVVSKGGQGRECKFSIRDVRAWRARDIALRYYGPEELDIMRESGIEHLNVIRRRVEDSARHFLWYSFSIGSDLMVEHFVETGQMSALDAKKTLAAFYVYWAHIYEKWLTEDAYNHDLKDQYGEDLDDEFHGVTCGQYKASSFPPSNFSIDTDIQIPNFFQHFMDEIVSAKKGKPPLVAGARKSARIDSARE